MLKGTQTRRLARTAFITFVTSIAGCADAPTWTDPRTDTEVSSRYASVSKRADGWNDAEGIEPAAHDAGAPALAERAAVGTTAAALDPMSQHFDLIAGYSRRTWYVNASKSCRRVTRRYAYTCTDYVWRICYGYQTQEVPPLGVIGLLRPLSSAYNMVGLLGSEPCDPTEDQSRLLAPVEAHFVEQPGQADEPAKYLNATDECRVAHFWATDVDSVMNRPRLETVEAAGRALFTSPFTPNEDKQIAFLGSVSCWDEPTMSFGAYPSRVRRGERSTLQWTSEDTEYCVDPDGRRVGSSGSLQVTVYQNSTYSMSCHGPGGSVTAHTNVQLVRDPPGWCPSWREPCYEEP